VTHTAIDFESLAEVAFSRLPTDLVNFIDIDHQTKGTPRMTWKTDHITAVPRNKESCLPKAPTAASLSKLDVPNGTLRIARMQERSFVLGPGGRGVIWFQGCSLKCRGCIAASMNAAPPLFLTSPERLSEWCLGLEEIEGITLSGGDPFDQPPEQLAQFLELVRSNSMLTIQVFTGRTLNQLRHHTDPFVERCLCAIDILIDGPYIEELNDGLGWRGSTNQVIHALGPRGQSASEGATAPRRVELVVSADGRAAFTGIPAKGRGRYISTMAELGLHGSVITHTTPRENL